jgi:predicted O-methyltransferase YrrM
MSEWFKRPIRPWVDRLINRVADRVVDRLYPQIEGLLALHRALDGRAALPTLRGGTVAPDTFPFLVSALAGASAPTVLEFGAGASTRVLAQLVAPMGGRVVSVEQDAGWVQRVTEWLVEDGTSAHATLLHAPLETRTVLPATRAVLTYPAQVLDALPAWDVALVDGPTGFPDVMSRLGPLQHVVQRLADGRGRVAFLDDAHRAGEREAVALAMAPYGTTLQVTWHATEKGTAELRR